MHLILHLIELQVPQGAKNLSEIQEYVRYASIFTKEICIFCFVFSSEMNVIDNQRILNQLSNKLEPRQT
jgi:hypothetical protein